MVGTFALFNAVSLSVLPLTPFLPLSIEKQDADAISRIPVEMLPANALRDMGGVKGRRASIDAMKKDKEKTTKVRRYSNLQVIPAQMNDQPEEEIN